MDRSTRVIADDRMFYDGLDFDAPPVKGELTKAEEFASHDGATASYVTVATTEYDAYGRVTSIANARGVERRRHTPTPVA